MEIGYKQVRRVDWAARSSRLVYIVSKVNAHASSGLAVAVEKREGV